VNRSSPLPTRHGTDEIMRVSRGESTAGNADVNVHTSPFPGGEVRGRIRVAGGGP